MATNGNPNIIAFDDARRMAATRSSRIAGGKAQGGPGRSFEGRVRDSGDFPPSRQGSYGSSAVERLRPSEGAWPDTSSRSFAPSRSANDIRLAGSARTSASSGRPSPRTASVRSAASDFFDDPAYREDFSRAALELYDPDLSDESADAGGPSRRERTQRKRRAKTKQKAARLFDRQFGGDDAEPSSRSSRPALYKGEMGRSHKRAFADLGSEKGRASAGLGASPSRSRSSKRSGVSPLAVFIVVAGCFIAAGIMLFPTARQFYIETREQARLQAEYDALSARNQAIESRLEYLKTDEGIEDVAHKELGWVYDGQVAGVVQGLDSSDASSGQTMIAQVKRGSVPTPETWHSPMLDMVFGYVDPVTVMPENTDLSNVNDIAATQTDGDASAEARDTQDS